MKRLNFNIRRPTLNVGYKDDKACQGFTLIELMIVIAIIGIITAIAIPNFISYRRKARIAGAAADIKNFEKGFIAYALDEGEFPDDSHIVLPDLPTMADYINPDVWGKTTALGKIWSTYPEISKYGKKYAKAVNELAAEAGNGIDALKPKISAVGKTCKGCHDEFREKN